MPTTATRAATFTQHIKGDVQECVDSAYSGHPDEMHHLRYMQVKESPKVAVAIEYAPRSTALMLGAEDSWTVALLGQDKYSREGARVLARKLPVGSTIVAPDPLGSKLAKVWKENTGRPVTRLAEDAYFRMTATPLLRPLHDLPVVYASDLGKEQAAEEMAFCWLQTRRQSVPASEFGRLLSGSDALLWRPEQPAGSFHLFTPLSPTHIMLGASCGNDAQLPYLFSHLAQRGGNVAALVATDNHREIARLQGNGFEHKPGMIFSTYRLG